MTRFHQFNEKGTRCNLHLVRRPKPVTTGYEGNQSFNAVTAWLHSLRYKNILDVFSRFVPKGTDPIKVVEIGCAEAKLFSILDRRFPIEYLGIDADSRSVSVARDRYDKRRNFDVVHESAVQALDCVLCPDVIVALETLEHIPEREVVRIVEKIGQVKPALFICSFPVEIGPAIWAKNIGSWLSGYMRHREYTWPETFWAGLYRMDRLPAHATGHKGFDWRWLVQTIRHNMQIQETRRFPFRFLPAAFSSSVFLVAAPSEDAAERYPAGRTGAPSLVP